MYIHTLESLKLLIVPGMNDLAYLEQPEPIDEASVPMIPRVVIMWFLLESARRALSAPGRSPRLASMNLAALMISWTLRREWVRWELLSLSYDTIVHNQDLF